MELKTFAKIFFISAISLLSSSCGSDSGVGVNITEFNTSRASVSASTTRLEADLITGNTCPAAGSTGGTILTESVDFTISLTSTAKGSGSALPIQITGYTVTFVPKNVGTPALTPITGVTSVVINPSWTASISVPITTDRQKVDLIAANPSFPCSLIIFQYDVFVSFIALEAGIEGSKTINSALVMAIADRNN